MSQEVDPLGGPNEYFWMKKNIFHYSYMYWSPHWILADAKLHEGGFAHPNSQGTYQSLKYKLNELEQRNVKMKYF